MLWRCLAWAFAPGNLTCQGVVNPSLHQPRPLESTRPYRRRRLVSCGGLLRLLHSVAWRVLYLVFSALLLWTLPPLRSCGPSSPALQRASPLSFVANSHSHLEAMTAACQLCPLERTFDWGYPNDLLKLGTRPIFVRRRRTRHTSVDRGPSIQDYCTLWSRSSSTGVRSTSNGSCPTLDPFPLKALRELSLTPSSSWPPLPQQLDRLKARLKAPGSGLPTSAGAVLRSGREAETNRRYPVSTSDECSSGDSVELRAAFFASASKLTPEDSGVPVSIEPETTVASSAKSGGVSRTSTGQDDGLTETVKRKRFGVPDSEDSTCGLVTLESSLSCSYQDIDVMALAESSEILPESTFSRNAEVVGSNAIVALKPPASSVTRPRLRPVKVHAPHFHDGQEQPDYSEATTDDAPPFRRHRGRNRGRRRGFAGSPNSKLRALTDRAPVASEIFHKPQSAYEEGQRVRFRAAESLGVQPTCSRNLVVLSADGWLHAITADGVYRWSTSIGSRDDILGSRLKRGTPLGGATAKKAKSVTSTSTPPASTAEITLPVCPTTKAGTSQNLAIVPFTPSVSSRRLIPGRNGRIYYQAESGEVKALDNVFIQDIVLNSPFSTELFPDMYFIGKRETFVETLDFQTGACLPEMVNDDGETELASSDNDAEGSSEACESLSAGASEAATSSGGVHLRLGSTRWVVRAMDLRQKERWRMEWRELTPISNLGGGDSSQSSSASTGRHIAVAARGPDLTARVSSSDSRPGIFNDDGADFEPPRAVPLYDSHEYSASPAVSPSPSPQKVLISVRGSDVFVTSDISHSHTAESGPGKETSRSFWPGGQTSVVATPTSARKQEFRFTFSSKVMAVYAVEAKRQGTSSYYALSLLSRVLPQISQPHHRAGAAFQPSGYLQDSRDDFPVIRNTKVLSAHDFLSDPYDANSVESLYFTGSNGNEMQLPYDNDRCHRRLPSLLDYRERDSSIAFPRREICADVDSSECQEFRRFQGLLSQGGHLYPNRLDESPIRRAITSYQEDQDELPHLGRGPQSEALRLCDREGCRPVTANPENRQGGWDNMLPGPQSDQSALSKIRKFFSSGRTMIYGLCGALLALVAALHDVRQRRAAILAPATNPETMSSATEVSHIGENKAGTSSDSGGALSTPRCGEAFSSDLAEPGFVRNGGFATSVARNGPPLDSTWPVRRALSLPSLTEGLPSVSALRKRARSPSQQSRKNSPASGRLSRFGLHLAALKTLEPEKASRSPRLSSRRRRRSLSESFKARATLEGMPQQPTAESSESQGLPTHAASLFEEGFGDKQAVGDVAPVSPRAVDTGNGTVVQSGRSLIPVGSRLAAVLDNGRFFRTFKDVRLIGKGGCGSVYQARHQFEAGCTLYAIKFVTLWLKASDNSLVYFREVATNKDLYSRHVVRYYTWWCEEPHFLPQDHLTSGAKRRVLGGPVQMKVREAADGKVRSGGVGRGQAIAQVELSPLSGAAPQIVTGRRSINNIREGVGRRVARGRLRPAVPGNHHEHTMAGSSRGKRRRYRPNSKEVTVSRLRSSPTSNSAEFRAADDSVNGGSFDEDDKEREVHSDTSDDSSDFDGATGTPGNPISRDASPPGHRFVDAASPRRRFEASRGMSGITADHSRRDRLVPSYLRSSSRIGNSPQRIKHSGVVGYRSPFARSPVNEPDTPWVPFSDDSSEWEGEEKRPSFTSSATDSLLLAREGFEEPLSDMGPSRNGTVSDSYAAVKPKDLSQDSTTREDDDDENFIVFLESSDNKGDSGIPQRVSTTGSIAKSINNNGIGNLGSEVSSHCAGCDLPTVQEGQQLIESDSIVRTSRGSNGGLAGATGSPAVPSFGAGFRWSARRGGGRPVQRKRFGKEKGGAPSRRFNNQARYPVVLLIQMELMNGKTLRQWLNGDRPADSITKLRVPITDKSSAESDLIIDMTPSNDNASTAGSESGVSQHLEGALLDEPSALEEKNIIELDLFRQLMKGVRDVHRKGVVHRDLKPENIFVNPEDMVLKIGDFGLAKTIEGSAAYTLNDEDADGSSQSLERSSSGRTQVIGTVDSVISVKGQIIGTPEYTAPEGGAFCTEKADIYSAALILLEMLCPKFETAMERFHVLDNLRNGQKVPTHIYRYLRPWYILLLAMTQSDPADRPSADVVFRAVKQRLSVLEKSSPAGQQ